MNFYNFRRDTPMPCCKHCHIQLDYWVLGKSDEDYECEDCLNKKISDQISLIVEKAFTRVLPKNDDQKKL